MHRLGPQLHAEWLDERIGGLWDFYCQSSLRNPALLHRNWHFTYINLTLLIYSPNFQGISIKIWMGFPFIPNSKQNIGCINIDVLSEILANFPYSWHPKWTAETRDAVGCHEGIARAAVSCLGRFRCHCQLHLPVNCGDMTGIPNNTNHQQKPLRVWDLMKID